MWTKTHQLRSFVLKLNLRVYTWEVTIDQYHSSASALNLVVHLHTVWPTALVTDKWYESIEGLRIVTNKFPIYCAIYSLWHLYAHGFLTLLLPDFHHLSVAAKGWSNFWGHSKLATFLSDAKRRSAAVWRGGARQKDRKSEECCQPAGTLDGAGTNCAESTPGFCWSIASTACCPTRNKPKSMWTLPAIQYKDKRK